jgi:hypothetical protein
MRKIKELEAKLLTLEQNVRCLDLEAARSSRMIERVNDLEKTAKANQDRIKSLEIEVFKLKYKPLFHKGQKVCLNTRNAESGERGSGYIILGIGLVKPTVTGLVWHYLIGRNGHTDMIVSEDQIYLDPEPDAKEPKPSVTLT